MKSYLVLRVIAKMLIPFMLLFALYVQFHGDFGPGGGFQAGVIAAAAVIFYSLIYGLPKARKVVPGWLVETMLAAGVPVSYTHLDVYKRQSLHCSCSLIDLQLLRPSAL